MTTRVHKPGWLKTLDKIMHPKRTLRRWGKRKARKLSGRRTYRPAPLPRRGGRHDIVPGRTIIEWHDHPELGRGRVLAFLPGSMLDVEFEAGARPPSGVPVEDVRVLA